jgi:3-deoxy-manno-octulosonate cytidylyltransferase (CMP-KDO synthetase)
LYFTRAANCPFTRDPAKIKNQDLYHHIGIYVYTAEALRKMVSLPVGVLEERESLEQLRALQNGMKIKVGIVENVPVGIDTIEDFEKFKAMVEG